MLLPRQVQLVLWLVIAFSYAALLGWVLWTKRGKGKPREDADAVMMWISSKGAQHASKSMKLMIDVWDRVAIGGLLLSIAAVVLSVLGLLDFA